MQFAPTPISESEKLRTVLDIVDAIRPLLAGHPPEIQGAALANCLAVWLARHHLPGDEAATHRARAELLANICGVVRTLAPINAKLLGTTP